MLLSIYADFTYRCILCFNLCYLIINKERRITVVFVLLLLYQFLLLWIDSVAGHPVTAWVRWLPVLTGALSWPVLTGLMDRVMTRG